MKNSEVKLQLFAFSIILSKHYSLKYLYIYSLGWSGLSCGTGESSLHLNRSLVVAPKLCCWVSWALEPMSLAVVMHQLSCFMEWQILVPWPEIESTSLELQGEFLTTGRPVKSLNMIILFFIDNSVQFSCSVVSNSATPWTAAHQASLSMSTPGVYPNSCPLSQRCFMYMYIL